MTRGTPHPFTSGQIRFVAEQVGIPENELKKSMVDLFRRRGKLLRAYLARVVYAMDERFNVALCVVSSKGEDEALANDVALVFSQMFGAHEHLDIIFLNERQETQIRKTCCPFFVSMPFEHPDFFLTSSEGYGLEDVRACYKEKRLINSHWDGYMLCQIDPPIVGQPYGLGEKDIQKVVIASRHSGHSIFANQEWPAYVHIARLVRDLSDVDFTIGEDDVESIGWAEIYDSSAAATAARRSP